METMILVAGLAVAGLLGIAAAFYFSIRPGNPGNKRGSRVQPDRTSHTRPDRYQANDSRPNRGNAAGRAATARNYRGADRSTGPDLVPDDRGPGRTRTRRPEPDADRWAPEPETLGLHADRWASDPEGPGLDTDPVPATVSGPMDGTPRAARGSSRPGSRRLAAEAEAEADQDGTARSRRRSTWLKRGDIDEELWPAETFGGVSDEQFWDDMASDKPLATTARTAAPDAASRRRPPDAVPLAGLGDTQAMGDRRGRGSENGRGGATGPQPFQTGPQQAQTGPQSYRTGPRPVQAGPQPYQTGPQQAQPGPQPYQAGSQPYQAGSQPYQAGPQQAQTGPQAAQTGPQPAYASASSRTETRRRSREEDPLTSAAFSLRTSGPVDGRSYQASRRSRELSREQYEATVSQDTQTFSLADTQAATSGYPEGVPPFRQSDSLPGGSSGSSGGPGLGRAAGSDRADGYRSPGYPYSGSSDAHQPSSVSTPPYGQNYGAEGYGYGVPANPAEDPRRSARPAGRASGGEANRATRPIYPPDGYQRGGTYQQRTYPQGNGYRGPYDPRGGDRR
jgi:hypothetical protein